MKVYIYNRQKDLPISRNLISDVANQVVSLEQKRYDEVSIYFVTRRAISKMHFEYFNDDSATDCISFPMDSENEIGYRVLGEVFVCPQVAIEYAANHQQEPEKEIILYVVHGLLHLLGYDDITAADRKKMRAAEKRNLQNILIKCKV